MSWKNNEDAGDLSMMNAADASAEMPDDVQRFIDRNRQELIDYVRGCCDNLPDYDDDTLEAWISNDEYLYEWALDEGVCL